MFIQCPNVVAFRLSGTVCHKTILLFFFCCFVFVCVKRVECWWCGVVWGWEGAQEGEVCVVWGWEGTVFSDCDISSVSGFSTEQYRILLQIAMACERRQEIKWAATSENVPSYMCTQRRLENCASAQSFEQSLCCPHEEIFHVRMKKLCILRYPKCALERLWSDYAFTAQMHSLIWIFAGRTCPKVRFLILRLKLWFTHCFFDLSHNGMLHETKKKKKKILNIWHLP